MQLRIGVYLALLFFFVTNFGCSVKWSKAIGYGEVSPKEFEENVDLSIQANLIFIQVEIKGRNYRFLVDSGAPFSISREIQNLHHFKTTSIGHIVDSDHSRQKTTWVSVDSLKIGKVEFLNQTAFIGDFTANPILQCLNIDGIIGSNLMRHCNWIIDQQKKQLTLNNSPIKSIDGQTLVIPFSTDYQYNIYVDLNIGRAKVKNLQIDYGSNGGISLNEDIFQVLKKEKIISGAYIERGFRQTGIVGQTTPFISQTVFSDSVRLNEFRPATTQIKTGKSDLVGNQVLSNFVVTIDWQKKQLILNPIHKTTERKNNHGFQLGYSTIKGIYVQSVIDDSPAFNNGLRPNMKVISLDSLDFERGSSFCDYIFFQAGETIKLVFINDEGQKNELTVDGI